MSSDPSQSKQPLLIAVISSIRWPLALVALGLMALVAYLWTLRGTAKLVENARDTVKEVGAQIGGIAEKFRTGRITNTFLAAIPTITSSRGGNLELATAEVTEAFSRSDERRLLWDLISLGETVTEIRVPVTYRYHVRLADAWHLEISGQTC